ncbi:MAG TPA: hypothetical protein GX745_02770 [Clostridiales bacterium]|nr:hypothetical protein [Clostridiales bacterium]
MKEYLIYKLPNNKYDLFIIGLDYHNVLYYCEQLEKDINLKDGILLIDQLLQTGNAKNRFVEYNVKNYKIDFYSAKNIILPSNSKYRRITSKILKHYFDILENSILSDNQKKLINEGKYI